MERIWDKVPHASPRSKEIDEHLDAALSAVEQSKPLVSGQVWPYFSKTLMHHRFQTQRGFSEAPSGELGNRAVAEVLRDIMNGKR